MRRRLLVGRLVLPLIFVAVVGCGGSNPEMPTVQNPTVKVNPVQLNSAKPGEKGSNITAQ
jgi:hypothetical protein